MYRLTNVSKTLTVADHSVSLFGSTKNCTELMVTIMAVDTYQGLLDKTFNRTTFHPSGINIYK